MHKVNNKKVNKVYYNPEAAVPKCSTTAVAFSKSDFSTVLFLRMLWNFKNALQALLTGLT